MASKTIARPSVLRSSIDAKAHWAKVYSTRDVTEVGWYEENPQNCLELIRSCELSTDDPIVHVGVGASSVIDCLLEAGFSNLVGFDICSIAIDTIKERLGSETASSVRWVTGDIAAPGCLDEIGEVALWHDRALFHFLDAERDRVAYRDNLLRVVRPGGFAIIACFSLTGVAKCSGLDVRRYDEKMIAEFLGSEFRLEKSLDHTYVTPAGQPRPYVYALLRRVG